MSASSIIERLIFLSNSLKNREIPAQTDWGMSEKTDVWPEQFLSCHLTWYDDLNHQYIVQSVGGGIKKYIMIWWRILLRKEITIIFKIE